MPLPEPICPRCGYDLSGLIASWEASCPLAALCTECGLVFDCRNVLSERIVGPRWFFEHARGPSLRRWLGTSRASLNPWRLTRELTIEHRVRVARIVYFAAWWLAIWYALMSVTRAFLPRPFSGITATIGSLRLPVDRIGPVLWPYGSWAVTTLWRSSTEPPVIQGALFGFLPWFLMPLSMLLLDETFSAASVRRVHILRGLAYSAPGAMLAVHAMIGLLLAGSTAFLARGIAAPPYVAIAVLYPAWLTAWWWLFIKRYLRLPHAPWIALVMMVASLLATASVLLWSSIPRI